MFAAIASSWTTFMSWGAVVASTSLACDVARTSLSPAKYEPIDVQPADGHGDERRADAPGRAAAQRVADDEAEHAEQEDDDHGQEHGLALVGRDLAVEGHGRPRVERDGPRPRAPAVSVRREVDVRHVLRLGLGLEELALGEAERAREEDVREHLDRVVVVEDGRVVVLAGERDLVLGGRQLLLEFEDVLVRLELGVVLDDREQRAQGPGQDVLGLGLGGGALGAGGDRVRAGVR